MLITINNFRCFRNPFQITVEDGKLYLLKGQSGAGKTTIFEAIRWGLFGNMRNIYPIGFTPVYGGALIGTNKTYVIIEYKNMTILRSQAPEQLRVTFDDNELTQEAAQKYIDSIFGNKNVWMASSFIRQNERCPLMAASNSERMSLLNEILFGNDNSSEFENPDFYIEKLDEELSKIDKEITGKTAVFNSHYTKYVESIKNFTNPYNWSVMTEEYIQQIEESINQFKDVISNLSTQLIEVSKLEARKKLLFEKLNSIEKDISSSTDIKDKIDKFYQKKNIIGNDLLTLKSNLTKSIEMQAKFSTLMEELNNAKKELELYKSSNEPASVLAEKIKDLKNKLQKTQTDENTLLQLQRQIETVKDELENVTKQRSQYDDILKNRSVECIQKIIENTSIYTKLQELHSNISKLNIDVGSLLCPDKMVIEKDSLNKQYNSIQFIEKLLKKYNINKDFSLCDKKSQYAETLKKYELQKEHLLKKTQADTIQKNIDSLSNQKMEIESTLSEVEIDEQIKLIERRIGAPLRCPNCECTLEYKNNTLVKPEAELITKEEGLAQINKLKQVKNTIIFNKSIEIKITSLNAQLEVLFYDKDICNEEVVSIDTINTIKNFLTDFQNYDTIPEESSIDIENRLALIAKMEQYHKLSTEYTNLSQKFDGSIGIENNVDDLTKAVNNIPLIDAQNSRLKNTLNDIQNKINSIIIMESSKDIQVKVEEITQCYNEAVAYELINSKIKRINSEITSIDLSKYDTVEIQDKINFLEKEGSEIDTNILKYKSEYSRALEYEETKKQYEEIKIESSEDVIANALEKNQHTYNDLLQQHSQAKYMLALLSSRKELEVLQEELMTLTTKQLNLNKLKSIITDVTNSALQDLVDNINTITNNILDELFDCGITIELKLYKEVKNKSKTKPYVNIVVVKDGDNFDITALSGGEQDRVSLALTTALSSLHISPLIFIDEGLSALDDERKQDCAEAIRKYLIPSKNVLLIEHSGNSAVFDEMITVGCC